jgi:hypothetical protein
MSGHGHQDAGADLHAGHDDHHDETTSDDFPADEPSSPAWLPLLGGALFLAAIFAFVVFGSDEKDAGADTAAAATATSATAIARPVGPPSARRPAQDIHPGGALPANHPQF